MLGQIRADQHPFLLAVGILHQRVLSVGGRIVLNRLLGRRSLLRGLLRLLGRVFIPKIQVLRQESASRQQFIHIRRQNYGRRTLHLFAGKLVPEAAVFSIVIHHQNHDQYGSHKRSHSHNGHDHGGGHAGMIIIVFR